MFAGLINQAKSTITGLVLKYVARASVAIPFVIAAGFALAAVTVMLVERFGHVVGYGLMAGGLAAIGVVAAIVVSVKEHQEEVAEKEAEKTDTAEVVTEAAAEAIVQTPVALLGTLFSARRRISRLGHGTPIGPQLPTCAAARSNWCALLAYRRASPS